MLFYICRQGAKGDEIIEALIANSATFDTKTSFSQVIWLLINVVCVILILFCVYKSVPGLANKSTLPAFGDSERV